MVSAGAVLLLSSTALATTAAHAQQAADEKLLEEIVVTATRRAERLQDVPISIQAFNTEALKKQGVTDFQDVARLLPSVSYDTSAPGATTIYIRGVSSGGDGNHSASLPSVGVYLDEQPITTILGPVDVNFYDIERVEALAGPQGTLFGASSQSGTIRIITNKPKLDKVEGGYDLELNKIDGGGVGGSVQGYYNQPINDRTAIRLVGWYKRDGGYIDNVETTRVFPSSTQAAIDNGQTNVPIQQNNAEFAEDDYNDVVTYGGRVALKIDLNDNWTVTPSLLAQQQLQHGFFAYSADDGDLNISHFAPERSRDRFYQAALTIEGKIGAFDLTYAGSYFQRDAQTRQDYSDYSFFYDSLAGYVLYDNSGSIIDPSQRIRGRERFRKLSQELRISSPSAERFRFVGGLFYQRQVDYITQEYVVDDLADALEVPGFDDTLWLTQQKRVDRDYAAFSELSYDLLDNLTLTGGVRVFYYNNSLRGFFGFGEGYSGGTGVAACRLPDGSLRPPSVPNSPCTNIDSSQNEVNVTQKINATYKLDPDKLVYFTWSRGFRPGGINRRGGVPYDADFLVNYEVGFKTSWLDRRVRWNGAFYWSNWKDFQFPFLGQNGLTVITNAGNARIRGFETDWQATLAPGLTFAGGMAFTDSVLTENYCGFTRPDGGAETNCPGAELAVSGARLPEVPRFKGNATLRYEFNWGETEPFLQLNYTHQSSSKSDLRRVEADIVRPQGTYDLVNFSLGFKRDNLTAEFFLDNAFDERAELNRFTQCAEQVCGGRVNIIPTRPRMFGFRFGQKF